MRKSLCLLLILVLCLPSAHLVVAESETSVKYEKEAAQLHTLGLFKGTTSGFDLESKPNRAQGAVMLVRLLGREDLAEERRYAHPFLDVPSWADAHVGYLYEFDLTTGMSKERFGSNEDLLAIHYATFILRALGYDDGQGDFHWNESLEKLYQINLIDSDASQELKAHIFLRDHVVMLSQKAIEIPMKDSSTRLIDKLISEGAVSEDAAIQAGLLDDNTETDQSLAEIDYEKINRLRNRMEYEFRQDPVNMQQVFEYYDAGLSAYDIYEAAFKYKEGLDVFEQIIAKVGELSTGLNSAIFHEDIRVIKLLLDNGADVDAVSTTFPAGNKPIETAMSIGYYYIYEKGTGERSRVDRKSDTSEIVNLLLTYGATISSDVMLSAILSDEIDFVKEHFFKEGFNVHSEGPVYIDLNRDEIEFVPGVVLWTISHAGNDELRGSKSMFMQLIYASFHGGFRYEMIEWFVQNGAILDDSLSQEQLDFLLKMVLPRKNNPLLYDFFTTP